MKEQKPLMPDSVEPDPSRPSPADQKANNPTHKNGVGETGEVRHLRPAMGEHKRVRPEMTMQTDVRRRASRGKLSREAMLKIGRVLVDSFDDVRKEGVPDRFKLLLQQFDERKDKGSS